MTCERHLKEKESDRLHSKRQTNDCESGVTGLCLTVRIHRCDGVFLACALFDVRDWFGWTDLTIGLSNPPRDKKGRLCRVSVMFCEAVILVGFHVRIGDV